MVDGRVVVPVWRTPGAAVSGVPVAHSSFHGSGNGWLLSMSRVRAW